MLRQLHLLHGAVIYKRNRVDIFCRLSTMHGHGRQTDRPGIEIGKISCQRCRLKTKHKIHLCDRQSWQTELKLADWTTVHYWPLTSTDHWPVLTIEAADEVAMLMCRVDGLLWCCEHDACQGRRQSTGGNHWTSRSDAARYDDEGLSAA